MKKNRYYKCLYKIWNKIISFDIFKKRVQCKTGHGQNEKKGEFGNPRSECLRFKCGTLIDAWTNMLTTLFIYFNFYYKLQLFFVCHAHYNPFTCGKGLLKILNFEKYFEFIFKFHIFLIVSVF